MMIIIKVIKSCFKESIVFKTILIGVILLGCSIFENKAQVFKDSDGNGLIEISFIEQIDSMRLNLTGVCATGVCNGYELTRSLDFNSTSSYRSGIVNTSYTTGSGWDPIGNTNSGTNSSAAFNAIFEGHGYTIDHLFINRAANNIGLFGFTWGGTHIRNIGVTNVSVSGSQSVGALVGKNYQGTITQSYATGSVSGYLEVGGLVGWNSGTITQSYATGNVTSTSGNAGGLVGTNFGGTITQSYATGDVTSTFGATGGLVGSNQGAIIHGYWNTDAIQTVAGTARTTVNKKGIGSGSGAVTGLTLSDMQSTSNAIQELGPGFFYYSGKLPKIHLGARVTVNGKIFTQTLPRITNIVTESTVADINQGTATSRATLTLDGIAFTANLIGVTNIATPFTITNIQNVILNQTITFTSIGNKTYGNIPFVLSATSSSSAGLSVLFSASNTLVSINTDIVTIKGAGTVSIMAYSENDSTFGLTNQIITIQKANQSISFRTLAQKTFRDAPFILSATSSAGLSVSYSASNTLVSININTVTISGVGTVSITAYSEDDSTFGFTNQIITIQKANQSIRFGTLAQKTFGDAYFILRVTSSWGLTVSYSASNTLVSININTVTIRGAGTVNITAYSLENDTIMFGATTQILTINKVRQSINFNALAQKTYGDGSFVLSATSSGGLTVSFSASNTLVDISKNTVTINGSGTVIITAYQIGHDTHLPDSATQILSITEANSPTKTTPILTFSAIPNLNIGRKYVLIASSNNPVAITFTSSDNDKLSIVGNVATAKAKGNVTITAHQEGNKQYNSATSVQNVTVLDPNLLVALIDFTAIPNLAIGQKYVLIANSNSPVAITFTSSDNNKLSIVGNTATARASGNVTITANQAGNIAYNPTASAQNVTVLDPALLIATINFTAIPNLNIGQKYVLIATSNSPVAITFTSSDNDELSIEGNTATAKAKGIVTITANQAGNTQYNAADAVVQNVTVVDPNLLVPTITFTAIPNLNIGQKYVLIVTSNSPIPIFFESSNEKIANVSGNTLTAVGTGTTAITAIQTGNTEFNAANAQQTVTVINQTGTTTTPTLPALTFVETHNTSIRIFPNPANDYITISYDKTQKVSSVKVYDMSGKHYELKMNHYELGMKADIKNLPKGEYILVIYGEKGEVLKTELLVFSY